MSVLEIEIDFKNRKSKFNDILLLPIAETEFNEPCRRPEKYQLESLSTGWTVFLRTQDGDNITAEIRKRDGLKFLGIVTHAENPAHRERLVSFKAPHVLKVIPGPGARRDDLEIGFEDMTPEMKIERLMAPIERAYAAEQAIKPGASVEILTHAGETLQVEISEVDGDQLTGTVTRDESENYVGEDLIFWRRNIVKIAL